MKTCIKCGAPVNDYGEFEDRLVPRFFESANAMPQYCAESDGVWADHRTRCHNDNPDAVIAHLHGVNDRSEREIEQLRAALRRNGRRRIGFNGTFPLPKAPITSRLTSTTSLVHADCGTDLDNLWCPKCHMYPDMQSTEFAL